MDEDDFSVETTEVESSAAEDFNSIGDIPEPSGQPNTSEEGSKYPGTWSEILDKIPSGLHESVAPALRAWDQGVTNRFEKIRQEYAPYEDFVKNKIPAEELRASYSVYQDLNENPTGFLENLRDLLIQRGMYQEASQVQEEIEDQEEDDDNNPLAEQVRQLTEFQNQILEQQQQAEQAAQFEQEKAQALVTVDQEFAALESKIGKITPQMRTAIADQALALSQRVGQEVPLEMAYQHLQKLIAQVRGASPGASAPRVVPSGGGIPSAKKPDLSNRDERVAAAEAIARQMQGQP